MVKPLNLVGQCFGRLEVIGAIPRKPRRMWLCRCTCGNVSEVNTGALRSGGTKSCGCVSPFKSKHGLSGTRLETKYHDMKRRCYSPACASYTYYGGRGIKVCDEWKNNSSAFFTWALEHGYEKGLELDRIDGDGNYTPKNCRFVTHRVNSLNRRYVRESVAEKARKHGFLPVTISSRLQRGWTLEKALSTPLLREGRK